MKTPPPIPHSPEALFRYQIVSAVLAAMARGASQADAIAMMASQAHPTLSGALVEVSSRSIYRWLAAHRTHGMAGLEPTQRQRCDGSVALSQDFLDFVAEQKALDPRASVPELIRRAREVGVVSRGADIDRVTVWRAARRLDLETRRRKRPKQPDMRRFAYPHRMQMILADGKHFRAGAERARRVALFFLDDASRLGLHVVVGTSESKSLFLRGLFEMVRRHGLFEGVFLDNGPGFIALDTGLAIAALGGLWILGTAGYPQGHGKIERFNQTAQEAVLRTLAQPGVDADCGALELRLQHYLRETYNHTPHESLSGPGQPVTPHQRWLADERALRFPDDEADLRRRFVAFEERRVTLDNTLSFESIDYEVPLGHVGQRVQIHRFMLDDTISIVHDGRLVRLHPVDLARNATSGRAGGQRETESTSPLPPTAAEMAFQRDLRPIVGLDGGFPAPNPRKES